MIVAADAGPIQYLVRIVAIGVLAPLYQRVLVPQSVALNCSRTTHRLPFAPGLSSRPLGVRFARIRPPILPSPFSIRANVPLFFLPSRLE